MEHVVNEPTSKKSIFFFLLYTTDLVANSAARADSRRIVCAGTWVGTILQG